MIKKFSSLVLAILLSSFASLADDGGKDQEKEKNNMMIIWLL
jgi:hypothetical protein